MRHRIVYRLLLTGYNKSMVVYIGADHGGYKLKGEIKKYLTELGYELEDMGAHALNLNDDYTDFVFPVAQKVVADPKSRGIVIGRSGQGEAIATNKVKGIRAAVCFSEEMARRTRDHNNSNILSLGADFVEVETAKRIVKVFLETPFPGEKRHVRRLKKIEEIEKSI